MGQRYTSAVLAGSLGWSNEAIAACEPHDRRDDISREAVEWQHLSQEGAQAESTAWPLPLRRAITLNGVTHVFEARQGVPPLQANRILELHGLMGAIGEQFGLAWTAEQDVQRLSQTRDTRDQIHHRIVARAQAEVAGHFLLGSVHSLGNLVLRLLLLNGTAGMEIKAKFRRADGFPPGADVRGAWPTLNQDLVGTLKHAAEAAQNIGMRDAVAAIAMLQAGDAFAALDGRRGMDYHRRRPQSVPHASPRAGTVQTTDGLTTISGPGRALEVEADEDLVHEIVVDALSAVWGCMNRLRGAVPSAIRSEGINYAY